jgi:DNA mismatch repair protein MutS2
VTEIDLRGLRADEVRSRLEPAIDAAMRADLPFLRIIHGKGTGALREIVAEMLTSDPRVRSWRIGELGEGGTGVTVAEL